VVIMFCCFLVDSEGCAGESESGSRVGAISVSGSRERARIFACVGRFRGEKGSRTGGLQFRFPPKYRCRARFGGDFCVAFCRDICPKSKYIPYSIAVHLFCCNCFSQANVGADAPSYTGLLIVAVLEHELAQVEGLRDLIKQHHDAIISRIEMVTRTPSLAGSIRQPGTAAEKAAAAIAECEEKLSWFYKGFVHFTLPMFARHRAAVMKRVCTYLSGVGIALNSSFATAAVRRCREMDLSPDAAVASTNSTLELLGVRALDTVSCNTIISQTETLVQPTSSTLSLHRPASPSVQGAHIMDGIFDTALAASGKLPVTPVSAASSAYGNVVDAAPTAAKATASSPPPRPTSWMPPSNPPPPVPTRSSPAPASTAVTSSSPASAPTPAPAPASSPVKTPAAPVPPPKPATAVFKSSEKSNSLLDDLMGGGSGGSNGSKDLWN
jgi:hypothetical protein